MLFAPVKSVLLYREVGSGIVWETEESSENHLPSGKRTDKLSHTRIYLSEIQP